MYEMDLGVVAPCRLGHPRVTFNPQTDTNSETEKDTTENCQV